MKKVGVLCMFLFLTMLGNKAFGTKRSMTFKESCSYAPLIVVVEVGKSEYETIPDGKTIQVKKFDNWSEYKILKILNNKSFHKNLKKGEILRISQHSIYTPYHKGPDTIKRKGKQFVWFYKSSKKTIQFSLKTVQKNKGKKMILLLRVLPPFKRRRAMKLVYCYLWIHGTTKIKWTKKTERQIAKWISSFPKKKATKKPIKKSKVDKNAPIEGLSKSK